MQAQVDVGKFMGKHGTGMHQVSNKDLSTQTGWLNANVEIFGFAVFLLYSASDSHQFQIESNAMQYSFY